MLRSMMLGTIFGVLTLTFVAAGDGEGEKKGKARPKSYTGQLAKIDDKSLTVQTRGDSGEKSETFTFTADTKFRVETDKDETVKVKGEGGERTVTKAVVANAKAADFKTGQRVMVIYDEDRKALDVLGLRAIKRGKEGGRE